MREAICGDPENKVIKLSFDYKNDNAEVCRKEDDAKYHVYEVKEDNNAIIMW